MYKGHVKCCVIGQVVPHHWLVTTDVQVHSRVSCVDFVLDRVALGGRHISEHFSLLHPFIISQMLHIHLLSEAATLGVSQITRFHPYLTNGPSE